MFVYSVSGVVLVFRDTDAFKRVEKIEQVVAANLGAEQLGEALGIRRLRVESQEGQVLLWKEGRYNASTGEATYTRSELPYVLDRMTHLHKAKSSEPLFFLNVAFGIALLFFVVSAFFMWAPGATVLKRGLWTAAVGAALTLVLLFV